MAWVVSCCLVTAEPSFSFRLVCVGFMVDEVALGEVFLQGHQSSLSVSFKNMLKKERKVTVMASVLELKQF